MTKALLATLFILALGCGVPEPASDGDSGGEDTEQAPSPVPQDPLRPPSGWQVASSGIPKVNELSLGRKPDSPWNFWPRNDVPVWDASLPLDWSADPFDDLNWQYQPHSCRNMEYWLHEYRRTDDAAHLVTPIEIALDWHRFHIDAGRTSAFQWYDHATGLRASRLGFLINFILSDQVELGEDDLARLMTLADLHAEKLRDPGFLKTNNHGLFQLVGLDALCSVVGWRNACQGARAYAKEAFAKLVRSWYSEEGVNVENSPSYHGWVTRQIEKVGATERFQEAEVQAIIETADEISPWLTYPDGRWVPVGDSEGSGPKLSGPIETICLSYDSNCWAVRDFTKSGYAVIRSLPETDNRESRMLFVSLMA